MDSGQPGGSRKGIRTWVVRTPARTYVIDLWERLNKPDAPRARTHRAVMFFVHFATYWVLVSAAMLFDPFSTGTITDRHSQDLMNRVLGAYYPDVITPLSTAGQSVEDVQSAVVLIDEATLAQMTPEGQRKWPARPSLHATFLQAILTYKPRAVMVDLLFVDALQGKTGAFERALRRYDEAGVPLVFAGTSGPREVAAPASAPSSALLAERLKAPPPLPVTAQLWAAIEEAEALHVASAQVATDDDGSLRHYAMRSSVLGVGETATAAAKLFELVAGRPPEPAAGKMTIFWSLNTDPVNRLWMDCREISTALPQRMLQAVLQPEDLRQNCPATATVPALELLIPSPDGDIDAKRMIEGNVVFYGTDIAGEDIFTTPVNRGLPGVYVHAMALDNLLRFGGGYLRDEIEVAGFSLSEDQVSLLLGAPLVALLVAAYLNVLAPFLEKGGWWRTMLVRGGLVVAAAVTSLTLAVVLLVQFRLAPINWIGLPLFGLPVMALADNHPLKKQWDNCLKWGNWCRTRVFTRTATAEAEATTENKGDRNDD